MRYIIFIFLQFFLSISQAKPVELIMWHSLAGQIGIELTQLVTRFNQSQSDYKVRLVYKGEYTEALTSFAAAFRAGQPPAIMQVFEVGKATMLYPKGIIKPVDELMQEQGFLLPKESFLPAVRDFYSETNQLLALPFNISIPVIFYNADALAKIGYTQASFPRTWQDMEILAAKLREAGYACSYTSAYPSWIQLESFAAIHGLSRSNKKPYTTALIHHLERLKKWQENHYFEYGGRASNATVLFTSGHCVLFSQSSGSYNSLAELVKFGIGVAPVPLDTQISSQRHNNIAGGAALWAIAGQTQESYQGIARFFSYLTQPETQQRWHQKTGYLPVGLSGIYASLLKKTHPVLALAQEDLGRQSEEPISSSVEPQNQIRLINDEALEVIFASIQSPAQAMEEAIERARYIVLRFARNTALKRH
ncbi:extracellular solute-binding protein [Legionella fairfieldensis]|uniref:extracellular solute-binding protein n=1 Tax=Legionella fairfieldensis TaxID=45064 RepID=UPI000A44B930|nr:extracellular solute-binding protein [Legionella fairfieldensis]